MWPGVNAVKRCWIDTILKEKISDLDEEEEEDVEDENDNDDEHKEPNEAKDAKLDTEMKRTNTPGSNNQRVHDNNERRFHFF